MTFIAHPPTARQPSTTLPNMKIAAQTVLRLWPKIQNRKWKWKIWFSNFCEFCGPHSTYIPNRKIPRRTDREILAKVETGSGKPKVSHKLLLLHTRYPRTKNEVSSCSGSKVMTESPKPKVKVKNWIFRTFSNSMVHTVPTYQIWRLYVEPIARY